MKKIITNIVLSIAVFFSYAFEVSAQVNETDISALDYAIYTSPASAKKGGQVTISVNLKNINSIATWQADLILPNGVTIAKDDAGDEQILLSTARTSTSRHSIGWNTQSDGSIRLLCGSNTNKTFTGTDGEVATIVLDVNQSLNEGSYPIIFKNILMVEPSQTSHSLDQTISRLDITPFTYTIIATSQNENYGTVTIESSSYNASTHEVFAGDQVTITAIPNNRYKFSSWVKNGTIYSNDNPLVVTAGSDLTIQAEFEGAVASSHLVKSSVVPLLIKAVGNMWEQTLTASLYNYTTETIKPSWVVLRYKNGNTALLTSNLDGQSVAPNDKIQVELKLQTSTVSWEDVNFGGESGIFGVDFFYIENGKEIYVASENTTIETVTIQAFDQNVSYDGGTHSIEYSCSAPGIFDGDVKTEIVRVNGDNVTVVSASDLKDAGRYNYSFSIDKFGFTGSKTAVLTISKATLSVTADNKSKVYGENNPQFTYTITGFVNNEKENVLSQKPSASCSATKDSNVGTYDIIVSGAEATNYDFIYNKGTLTITKASQSISWDQTFGTLKEGDQIELTATSSSGEPVTYESSDSQIVQIYSSGGKMMLNCKSYGTATITAKQVGSTNYYDATPIEKTITIEKSITNITINVSDAIFYYDGKTHQLSFSLSSSEVNTDDVTIEIKKIEGNNETTVSSDQVKDAGKYHFYYSISKDQFTGNANAFLTIYKTSLVVTADDKTMAYGEEIPELTYVITGFVNDESVEVLSAMPIASTDYEHWGDVGEYVISVEGGGATNYDFIYFNGKLTIVKANQTIVWDQEFTELEVEQVIALEAYSTSGLDVSYSLSNANASIEYIEDIPNLKCLVPGIVVVYAMQTGNNNYQAAETIQKTITIKESSGIDNIYVDTIEEEYYDIFGRRANPRSKGFLISPNKNAKTAKILIE